MSEVLLLAIVALALAVVSLALAIISASHTIRLSRIEKQIVDRKIAEFDEAEAAIKRALGETA
jgi:hypothetical protein